MARSTDPLRRGSIQTAAQLPGASLSPSQNNSALLLATSLRDTSREARQAFNTATQKSRARNTALAQRDAIATSGAQLADAVRDGRIRKTQNPFYVQAYNRESAAIRSQRSLQQLQVESQTWDEKDDHVAFEQRWRKEVGDIALQYEGEDAITGFKSAEAQVTPQVLQSNVATNSTRIVQERDQNLVIMGVEALSQQYAAVGGNITVNQALQAIAPVAQQHRGTGGSEIEYRGLLEQIIDGFARAEGSEELLSLKSAPELLNGLSKVGERRVVPEFSSGQALPNPPEERSFGQSVEALLETLEDPPEAPAQSPSSEAPAPSGRLKGDATFQKQQERVTSVKVSSHKGRLPKAFAGFTRTSGFGPRKRPTRGASTFHRGVDYRAKQGTPLKLPFGGEVTFSGNKRGLGFTTEIRIGPNLFASVGHMSRLDAKKGDFVAADQVFGLSGGQKGTPGAGTSTGPHLHYSVFKLNKAGKRQYLNPEKASGEIGGDFPVTRSSGVAGPQSSPLGAFPGDEKAFRLNEETPFSRIGDGPNLMSLPGVASRNEATAAGIRRAREQKIMRRVRERSLRREAQAFEAMDHIYETYGSNINEANLSPNEVRKSLLERGYSLPVANAALAKVRAEIEGSIGLDNAIISRRSQDPSQANATLRVYTEAVQSGYSEDLQTRVENMVTQRVVAPAAAQQIINTALSTAERQANKNERDANRAISKAEQEAAQRKIDSRSDLNVFVKGKVIEARRKLLTHRNLTKTGRTFRALSPDRKGSINWDAQAESAMQDAVLIHLSKNPNDYAGAQREAALALQNFIRQTANNISRESVTRPSSNRRAKR